MELPCDIINNILIIQQKEHLKTINILKKKCNVLKYELKKTELSNDNMLSYLDSHGIKYCELCGIYGNEDEIIFNNTFNKYYCEHCLDFREESEDDI